MRKHASGPWKWDDQELIAADGSIVCDDGSAYGEYCVRLHPGSANARLIAAAPDLLEALENLVHWSILLGCDDDMPLSDEYQPKEMRDALSIIRKARGEA